MTGLTVGTSGGNAPATVITVGTSGGNKDVLEGWVGTSGGNQQFYSSAVAPSYDWTNLTGTTFAIGNSQTITAPITLRVNYVVALYSLVYSKNGATGVTLTNGGTISTTTSDTIRFSALYNGSDVVTNSVVTVRDDSSGTTIDTFTTSLSG